MRRRFALAACVLSAGLGAPGPVRPQADGLAGWVSLVAPGRVGWLENENRLGELCGRAADLDACYREHLAPLVDVYALHVAPDTASERIGDLVVTGVPGRGLSAYYRPAGTVRTTPFMPDVFLQDWGYGPPYFHHTVLESRDGWYRLPADPWATPVWLNGGAEGLPELHVYAGDIVLLEGRGFYVVQTTATSLTLRPEQPADMWCEEGNPPPLGPAEPRLYEWQELLDERGHLTVRPKYMKGC